MAGALLVAESAGRRTGVTIRSVDGAGGLHRDRVGPAVAEERFETGRPVRSFPSYRGQQNFPGLWWSSTTGRHVGYESQLERDWAMLLDFDPGVTAYSAQPFELCWPDEAGQPRRHIPDYFARLDDGSGVVLDCRAEERRSDRDVETFAATEQICTDVGRDTASWARSIRCWQETCGGWPATATPGLRSSRTPAGCWTPSPGRRRC